MSRLLSIILFALSLLSACSPRPQSPDPRLAGLDEALDDAPDSVLAVLTAMPEATLSPCDRALRNFLIVKAQNAGKTPFTSDSLVLTVVDYARYHRSLPFSEAEALYLAGRVYADLGDQPSSINFLQQALDLLPASDNKSLPLRSRTLRQIGYNLRKVNLYQDAIPYFEQALELSRKIGDTDGQFRAYEALGYTFYRLRRLADAEAYMMQADKLSKEMPEYSQAYCKVHLAEIKRLLNKNDEALQIIRNSYDKVSSSTKEVALSTAAKVYFTAAIFDSAAIYAGQLIESSLPESKSVGYWILLTPEMRPYSHPDTLYRYVYEYAELLKKELDNNDAEAVANRHNFYNYQKHLRRAADLEQMYASSQSKFTLLYIIIGVLTAALLGLSFVLLRRKGVRLTTLPDPAQVNREKEEKRLLLLDQINARIDEIDVSSNDMADTEIFSLLQQMADEKKTIVNKPDVWRQIEDAIHERHPDFKTHLDIIAKSEHNTGELHMAYLLRLGIRNVHIQTLLSLSKGGIDSRVATLSTKIFGTRTNAEQLKKALFCL